MITITQELTDLMQKLVKATNGKVKVEIEEGYYSMDADKILRFGFKGGVASIGYSLAETKPFEQKRCGMTDEQIDTLWFKAMRKAEHAGEMYTRHRFAKMLLEAGAKAEREACAKVCEHEASRWIASQPNIKDFEICAAAIRARCGQ